ncbi:MAG: hypothetical protein ACRD9R_09915 [Pyrinomonadaceae bacterium]
MDAESGTETTQEPKAERPDDTSTENSNSPGLEEAARSEHEYLRGRLRDELGREPSEEELNEWLRQHTEGY